EPARDGQVELDAARVDRHLAEVELVQVEVGTLEMTRDIRAVQRRAYGRHSVGAEEDEASTGPEYPVRLRDPGVGIAPDGRPVCRHGEAEARVPEGCGLGVAVDQGEFRPVLSSQAARRGRLVRRVVYSRAVGSASCHPPGHVAGAAAQLYGAH